MKTWMRTAVRRKQLLTIVSLKFLYLASYKVACLISAYLGCLQIGQRTTWLCTIPFHIRNWLCSKDLQRMQRGVISPEEATAAARREATEQFEKQQAAFKEQQRLKAQKVRLLFASYWEESAFFAWQSRVWTRYEEWRSSGKEQSKEEYKWKLIL